MSKFII